MYAMERYYYPSIASCDFDNTGKIAITNNNTEHWELVELTNNNDGNEEITTQPCVYSCHDTTNNSSTTTNVMKEKGMPTIQINSIDKGKVRGKKQQYNGRTVIFPQWNSTNFHTNLRMKQPLPDDTNSNPDKKVVVLLFTAIAREGIAIAISSQPNYCTSNNNNKNNKNNTSTTNNLFAGTIQILLGAEGNTCTVISSPLSTGRNRKNESNITIIPGRVCTDTKYISYWICLESDTNSSTNANRSMIVYVGIGPIPGQNCIAIHPITVSTASAKYSNDNDDERRDDNDNNVEQQKQDDNKDDDDNDNIVVDEMLATTTTIQSPQQQQQQQQQQYYYYIGFTNSSYYDRQVPLPIKIQNICLTSLSFSNTDDYNSVIVTTELYKLCQQYHSNPIQYTSSIPIIDITNKDNELLQKYKEQYDKAQARAIKFGITSNGGSDNDTSTNATTLVLPTLETFLPWSDVRKLKANPIIQNGFITGINLLDPNEITKQQKRQERFGISVSTNPTAISTDETIEVSNQQPDDNTVSIPIEQAWDNEIHVRQHRVDPPLLLWKYKPLVVSLATPTKEDSCMDMSSTMFYEKEPVLILDKIHLFSIDWSCFKQIRTNDIMYYFNEYSPTYIEWLGDLSCNVHFQDQYTAQRALLNLSSPIQPLQEQLQLQTLLDIQSNNNTNDKTLIPDLGAMGWYIGKQPLYKLHNDKYGKKGTIARILVRTATSYDILQIRPNTWPKPPPGFTTNKILQPGCDMYLTTTSNTNMRNNSNGNDNSGKKNNRNDNRNNNNNNRNVNENDNKRKQKRQRNKNTKSSSNTDRQAQKMNEQQQQQEEPTGIYKGLSSSRDGFSIEEMEAERAKKRMKN